MSSTATYKMREYGDGTVVAETSVSWSVSDDRGRNAFHSGQRSGEIHTRARFRAWCKKYGLTPTQSEVHKLPRTVWWLK